MQSYDIWRFIGVLIYLSVIGVLICLSLENVPIVVLKPGPPEAFPSSLVAKGKVIFLWLLLNFGLLPFYCTKLPTTRSTALLPCFGDYSVGCPLVQKRKLTPIPVSC